MDICGVIRFETNQPSVEQNNSKEPWTIFQARSKFCAINRDIGFMKRPQLPIFVSVYCQEFNQFFSCF